MKIRQLTFWSPIPIPGTHVRQATFHEIDGWNITKSDGCFEFERTGLRFFASGSASWVVAEEEETSAGDFEESEEVGSPLQKKRGRPRKVVTAEG